MPSETISITNGGGHKLEGALELPTGLVRGVAVFAHCFTCTKQSRAAVSVTRALASEGIACLRTASAVLQCLPRRASSDQRRLPLSRLSERQATCRMCSTSSKAITMQSGVMGKGL